jgi:hypothetical protein
MASGAPNGEGHSQRSVRTSITFFVAERVDVVRLASPPPPHRPTARSYQTRG